MCSHWFRFLAQFWSHAGKRCYLALIKLFASFRQLNCTYPNRGHCLRKRFVFLSWRHSSDEYNLSCNVWLPHRGWRYACIPLLRQGVFFCVLKSETARLLGGLLKVCLLVCGMVQNQRSLQSWGEAWLLAWQYQCLTAEINKLSIFTSLLCAGEAKDWKFSTLVIQQFYTRGVRCSLCSQVHVLSVQSSVRLLQQNYYSTVIK